jgi:xanthine dehydrogenase YagR molybdenum-binding subunit
MDLLETRAIGASLERMDGRLKVMGTAPYAFEQRVDRPAYLHPVQSTIARGRIHSIDTSAAGRVDGVIAVITHWTAPRLASDESKELWV